MLSAVCGTVSLEKKSNSSRCKIDLEANQRKENFRPELLGKKCYVKSFYFGCQSLLFHQCFSKLNLRVKLNRMNRMLKSRDKVENFDFCYNNFSRS